ncbi:MAG TPA: acid phosphatase [Rudaea sp.]
MRYRSLLLPAFVTFFAGSLDATAATTATTAASLDDIQTIVVIFAENRGFDHLYGNFPGANGIANATPAQMTQIDRNGTVLSQLPPVNGNGLTDPSDPTQIPTEATRNHPNQAYALDDPNGYNINYNYKLHDLVHRFYNNQMQIDGGKNDKFAAYSDAGGEVMGHYNSGSTMAMWKIAQQYVLADNFFQGAFGGSFLNHQYLICACAPYDFKTAADPVTFKSAISAVNPDGVSLAIDTTKSPASALDGVPVYVNDAQLTPDFYGINTMQPPYAPTGNADPNKPGYGDLTKASTLSPQAGTTIGDLLTQKGIDWAWYAGAWQAAIDKTAPSSVSFQFHHQPFNYYQAYAPGTAARTAHLRDGGLSGAAFIADIDAGHLPPVTFYKPEGDQNQHAGYATVANGDAHIADVIHHLENSPQWAHMVVVVTYDENGGWWDHVAPPKGDRWGPGTRVPAIIVSPFARKGTVDHTQYDTASILRLITHRFNLPVLPGLQARDQALQANGQPVMGDLTSALNIASTGITSGYTGSWYDPAQSGHGVNIEVLGDRLFATWYVYNDAGQQAWIFGVGPITGGTATMTAYRGINAFFPPNFQHSQVQTQTWGTLTFTFNSCNSGQMDWTTTVPGFGNGSGSLPLTRLTLPSGLTCQ